MHAHPGQETSLLPPGVHLWRLSAGGDGNLGLCCTAEDGLFLGRTPLIERAAGEYAVRQRSELEQLFKCSSAGADIERLQRGLGVVKSALNENNLALAQIAAVQLRIPDLPDLLARAAREAKDRLIKAERGGLLARAGWDPDKHPRAGTPPNPGWFAPTDAHSAEGQARESGSPILPVAERSTGNPDYAARALGMDRKVLS